MSARQQPPRQKQPAASPSGEPPERLYSIGELADELKVTTRAIRFYEDVGLLTPARAGRRTRSDCPTYPRTSTPPIRRRPTHTR